MSATRPARGRWARLATEGRNPRSRGLDTLSTPAAVALLLDEDRRALVAASRASAKVARAARLLADVLAQGGDVVFLGAGTSGRLGVLEAAECPPTFGLEAHRIRAVMAGGRDAVFLGREGAEDDEAAGRAEGEGLRAHDLLVGITASGVTPFVRGALAGARSRGASTALLTCAAGRLPAVADVVVAFPTGPEVLTGSTRLKAGSATKAVLNAITTAAMVRLGKVYENLMVDVQPTSAKLVDRSRRIVAAAVGVDAAAAAQLLAAAGGELKTAVVVGRLGIGPDEARERLRRSQGRLRQALGPSRRRP